MAGPLVRQLRRSRRSDRDGQGVRVQVHTSRNEDSKPKTKAGTPDLGVVSISSHSPSRPPQLTHRTKFKGPGISSISWGEELNIYFKLYTAADPTALPRRKTVVL